MATSAPLGSAPGQAITTLPQLNQAIAAYMNRTDLDPAMGTFVGLAEARIALDLRHWQMVKAVTLTVPGADGFVAVPFDWLEWDRLAIGGNFLEYMTREEFQEYAMAEGGDAFHYTMTGGLLTVALPSTATTPPDITVQASYYARIPTLNDTVPSNWLLEQYPMVYLYASLVSACEYVKDEPRAQGWAQQYAEAVASVNAQSYKAVTSGGPLRMRMR